MVRSITRRPYWARGADLGIARDPYPSIIGAVGEPYVVWNELSRSAGDSTTVEPLSAGTTYIKNRQPRGCRFPMCAVGAQVEDIAILGLRGRSTDTSQFSTLRAHVIDWVLPGARMAHFNTRLHAM